VARAAELRPARQLDGVVVRLDWPDLVGVTWLATLFFARGRVGRPEGALLVVLYAVYVTLHIAFG
jgi:Ca2+/Na+ antiporter